jgi:hypothetical protein
MQLNKTLKYLDVYLSVYLKEDQKLTNLKPQNTLPIDADSTKMLQCVRAVQDSGEGSFNSLDRKTLC